MTEVDEWRSEEALLVPVRTYLFDRFAAALEPATGRFDKHAEIIARRGAMVPLGSWSRPDLALVTVWRPVLAGPPQLRLYTFEVKTTAGASVESVYEALAHSRFGHRSYLVWHAPEPVSQSEPAAQIRKACERHGVGLITMAKPRDSRSYVVEIPATQLRPEIEVIDEFVVSRFSAAGREAIVRMLSN